MTNEADVRTPTGRAALRSEYNSAPTYPEDREAMNAALDYIEELEEARDKLTAGLQRIQRRLQLDIHAAEQAYFRLTSPPPEPSAGQASQDTPADPVGGADPNPNVVSIHFTITELKALERYLIVELAGLSEDDGESLPAPTDIDARWALERILRAIVLPGLFPDRRF